MVESTRTDASWLAPISSAAEDPGRIPLGGDIGYAKKKRRGSDQAIQATPSGQTGADYYVM